MTRDDIDDLVYSGRIVERMSDPRLRPLSQSDFRQLEYARERIWRHRRGISDVPILTAAHQRTVRQFAFERSA